MTETFPAPKPEDIIAPALITGVPEHLKSSTLVPVVQPVEFPIEGSEVMHTVSDEVRTSGRFKAMLRKFGSIARRGSATVSGSNLEESTIVEGENNSTPLSVFEWGKPQVFGNLVIDTNYMLKDYDLDSHKRVINKMREEHYPGSSIEIMEKGTLGGKAVDDIDDFVRNGQSRLEVRTVLAKMTGHYPNEAKVFIDNDIVGVHATESSALFGIAEQGALLSGAEARRRGVARITGEHIWQNGEGQKSISFATLNGVNEILSTYGGKDYGTLTQAEVLKNLDSRIAFLSDSLNNNPDAGERYKNAINIMLDEVLSIKDDVLKNPEGTQAKILEDKFPVLIAVNRKEALKGSEDKPKFWDVRARTSSELKEFRTASEVLDLRQLVIMVPSDRIKKVKDFFIEQGRPDTKVIALEALTDDRVRIN